MIRPKPSVRSHEYEVGIHKQTIVSMVGNGFDRVEAFESIATGSRNILQRVELGNASGASETAVLKWYLPDLDVFFEHRYRREEKILALLNLWFPQRVPKVYGGIIVPGRVGILILEDLGSDLLEDNLAKKSPEERHTVLSQAIDMLVELHTVTQSYYTPFFRICYSIELDRLTLRTYARKLRIALNRLIHFYGIVKGMIGDGPIADELGIPRLELIKCDVRWGSIRDSYNTAVIRPLIDWPRGIIHNSFSPSHLLLHNGRLKVIDFETMTVGAAQVDLAEFLRHPSINASPDEVRVGMQQYLRSSRDRFPEVGWGEFERTFWCANISRSLDYAGTMARRCVKYLASSQVDSACKACVRCLDYLDELVLSVDRLAPDSRNLSVFSLTRCLCEATKDAVNSTPLSTLCMSVAP